MHARISTYDLPEEHRSEGVRAFREALEAIAECPGFTDGYYLVSCDGERAMTLTLWDTRATMEASRVKASRVRSEAAGKTDGGVVSSEEFEVAVELSRPSAAQAHA